METDTVSGIAVLGATGSIGRSTLDVLARNPERFRVELLSAYSDVQGLVDLCARFAPRWAVIDAAHESACRAELAQRGVATELLGGIQALDELVAQPQVDQVVAGIVGAAGLASTLAALKAHKRVLVANKEPLVMAGALCMQALADSKATLIPLDSEHNAVFQCLPQGSRCGQRPNGVRKIWLTASGGPFRNTALDLLSKVTPQMAVRHPNWEMGPKISVDSATMMNKGLEVIEASWLFAMKADEVDVLLHPQSAVHALVGYADGSLLAQLGAADMRTPIAQALAWPERIESGVDMLDLIATARLDFAPVDTRRYPCFALAQAAARQGGLAATVLNAANEVAVQAFLGEAAGYLDIPRVVEQSLAAYGASEFAAAATDELAAILACDAWARAAAHQQVAAA